jgi:hypothetical protein
LAPVMNLLEQCSLKMEYGQNIAALDGFADGDWDCRYGRELLPRRREPVLFEVRRSGSTSQKKNRVLQSGDDRKGPGEFSETVQQ